MLPNRVRLTRGHSNGRRSTNSFPGMTFARLFSLPDRPRSRTITQFAALLDPMEDARLAELASQSQTNHTPVFRTDDAACSPRCTCPASALTTVSIAGFREIIRSCESLSPIDEVEAEARYLVQQGFRNILLVSGEHPKFVSNGYLRDVVRRLISFVPSVSLEVAPMEVDDYRPLVSAGAEGLVVYQETYDRETYAKLHTAGPKRDFDWRLETPERAYAAGFPTNRYRCRSSDLLNGDRKRSPWPNISNISSRNAGARNLR